MKLSLFVKKWYAYIVLITMSFDPNNLYVDKGERGIIIGQTGCGKSHLAVRLLPKEGPLLIIDPKRLLQYPARVIDSPDKLEKRDPLQRFLYRPKEKYLTDIAAYDAVYKWAYHQGKPITVYTDDLVGVLHKNSYPEHLGFNYMMGRAKDIRMLSAIQRPRWVPLYTLTESTKLYVFRLVSRDDIRFIQSIVPGYDPKNFRSPFGFTFYNVKDAGSEGVNLVIPK
jgi:energy-coupling factor transporter ATP-binding protein EcfA2